MIDVSALQMLLVAVTAWLDHREREALAYLMEENRVLRRQLSGRRLRLTDDDRRQLAGRAPRLAWLVAVRLWLKLRPSLADSAPMMPLL